jgi:hypothetical protein
LESKVARLTREMRSKDAQARECKARLEEKRSSMESDEQERAKLDERLRALSAELARKDRHLSELKQRVEQREASLISETSAVEQRAAQSAAEPLKRQVERKEAALRASRGKIDSLTTELGACKVEVANAVASGLKREARARRQVELKAEADTLHLSTQLKQAGEAKGELRLLLHRLAHALESDLAGPGGHQGGIPASAGTVTGTSGTAGSAPVGSPTKAITEREAATPTKDEETARVRALAHSLLQLSPEQLGLSPVKADIGGGDAPPPSGATTEEPHSSSHVQQLLRAALSDPIDTAAAFDVFSRVLQERAAAQAQALEAVAEQHKQQLEQQQQQSSEQLSRLGAMGDVSVKLRHIKEQMLKEKGEAEVSLAQRDRLIAGLRAQLAPQHEALAAPTSAGRAISPAPTATQHIDHSKI